jgi:hypothetical protein
MRRAGSLRPPVNPGRIVLADVTLLCYGDFGGRRRTDGGHSYSKGLIGSEKILPCFNEVITRPWGHN